MSQPPASKWTGSLRFIPYLIGFIFLASATTLSLATTSAIQVYKAPLDHSLWNYGLDYRWSLGWHIAYFITAPIVSTVHSCFDLILYVFSSAATGLNPVYAVISAAVLTVGWSVQCAQFYLLQDDRTTPSMMGKIFGVDENVTAAKIALGCMVLVLYFAYFLIASMAVYRSRAGHRATEHDMNNSLNPVYEQRKRSRNNDAVVFYA